MSKSLIALKKQLKYFEKVSQKLGKLKPSDSDEKVVSIYQDIEEHIEFMVNNLDYSDAFDPEDAIDGDNGDIEDGENMLFYYQQLIRDGDYDTSDTNEIYKYFVGGSKIKSDDSLYVNHIADEDEPQDVEPETAKMLKDGVVDDIIYDLEENIKKQSKK